MNTPKDTPYSSTVLSNVSTLAPLTTGVLVHKDKYQIVLDSGETVYNSSYIHDEASGESVEIAREEVSMDGSGLSAQMSFGVLQEDSGVQTIQNIISTTPSSTTISSFDSLLSSMCNLKIDGSGISWDRDDACLYLSSNKRFRFQYVESDLTNPARLSLQGYDDDTSLYVTKAEFFTN